MAPKNNRLRKDEQNKPSWKRRLVAWIFNACLIGGLVVGGYVAFVYMRMPSLDAILNETRPAALTILDKNGNEIRSSGRIMGTPVSVDSIPPHVWQAIVAIED